MSRAFLLFIIVLVTRIPVGTATAQNPVPQPERVIHLWVDPQYGDDQKAAQWNPGGIRLCTASDLFPNHVYDPNQSSAVLLHDSWPFLTVTAAINSLPAGGLPYSNPSFNVIWKYAIIHVLPGMLHGGTGNYASNGYPYNGETFPIILPKNVSIQGTSALNTMVFPDLDGGPAFEFGVPTSRGPANGDNTFIDGLSIFGARKEEQAPQQGAAIWLNDQVSSHPTISNCFIFGNDIGIMVQNSTQVPPVVQHDGLKLVNNTIAWNTIGVWNGQQIGGPPAIATGYADMILVNNILDATPRPAVFCNQRSMPTGWLLSGLGTNGVSAMEGVSGFDMIITGASGGNFNAYEWDPNAARGNFDRRVVIIPGLSATRPQAASPGAPGTLRNIATYTGWTNSSTTNRGILYIRDLICNGQQVQAGFQATNMAFDGSPGDFRLSPAVADAASTPVPPGLPGVLPGPGGRLNPLVDNGYAGSFPIVMANMQQMLNPPGTLVLSAGSQSTWPFTTWDWDCEGFGNRRIYDHPIYANSGVGGPDYIDIGADELGESILAGYRFGTTHFMEINNPANLAGASPMDNKYVWFINVPNGPTRLINQTPYPIRPYYRDLTKTKLFSLPAPWPDPNLDTTNYPTYSWHAQWKFLTAPFQFPDPNYYNPTVADISPYFPPDWHPWWAKLPPATASFPEWRHCLWPTNWYNVFLYNNPLVGRINPPGTFTVVPPQFVQWLDISNGPSSPLTQFGPYGGGPGALFDYDDWARGGLPPVAQRYDKMLVTSKQTTPLVGLRFSLETFDATIPQSRGTWNPSMTASNLQSLLVIVEKQ